MSTGAIRLVGGHRSAFCAHKAAAYCPSGSNHPLGSGRFPPGSNVTPRRKTIAILVDHLELRGAGYEYDLRTAFDAACQRLDFNLLIMVGRTLGDPIWAGHNSIYDLVDAKSIDGLILVAASLVPASGSDVLRRFCERHRPLPMCSLGLLIDGVPSVVVDGHAGMSAAVEHLIVAHRRRRIACLPGPLTNPDAQERLEAYYDVVGRHGMARDESLIEGTHFEFQSGFDAVIRLLDQGAVFDAIVAGNDGTGIGAMEALKQRGLRVPDDVMVTGFDDVLMSRLGDPPLSTVRQPLERMAELSVEMIAEQLAHRPVPALSELRTEFIARESCGCEIPELKSLPASVDASGPTEFIRQNQRRLARLLATALGGRADRSRERAQDLLLALVGELDTPGTFLVELRNFIAEDPEDNEVFAAIERAITLLRREFAGRSSPELEELWHVARQFVSASNTRAHAMQRIRMDNLHQDFLTSSERLSTVLNLAALKQSLFTEFAYARMTNALVALCGPSGISTLMPLVALRDGAALSLTKPDYDPNELLRASMFHPVRRETLVALPLTSDNQPLGVFIFENSMGAALGGRFREQISSVLKTTTLHQELVSRAAAEERNHQERAATAERMKSLSVLAGGVAHDLNNALGPLVGLSEVVLDGVERLAVGQIVDTEELVQDLKTIKSAGLRAAQTIKDLLTLGRQGQVRKEQLDLNQVVLACTTIPALGPASRDERPARISVKLCDYPLFVNGSESHLTRALTNLVQNATEAGESDLCIDISTESVVFSERFSGSELIEPGEYALVKVSDTGPGIPAEALGRIFEPFFSMKKLGERSGSGLGLSIVHGVVKEHGGFVDVKSRLGVGTTFTLFLPQIAACNEKDRHDSSTAPRGAERILGERVLVVDDDPVQLRTARRILERLGYRVSTADSSEQAFKLLLEVDPPPPSSPARQRQSPFNLVLMDMILRDHEDGLIVFQRILRHFPEQRGLLVSGHAPTDRSALAFQLGLSWLSKPYTSEALARAVHTAAHPSLRPPAQKQS